MKNTINTALSSTILIAAGTLFTNTASADVINLKDYSSTGTISVSLSNWGNKTSTINLEGDSLTQNIKMSNPYSSSSCKNILEISSEKSATISGNIDFCGYGMNYLNLNGGASFDFTGNITVSTSNESSSYGGYSHHVFVNLNSAATQNFSGVISSQYPSSPKHFMYFSSANDAAAVNHTVNISNINNTFDGCYVLDAGELSGSVVNDRKTTLEVSNNAIKDATVLLTENTVLKITEAGTQVSRITGTTGEINIAENASLSGGLNVLSGQVSEEVLNYYENERSSYGVVQYSNYKSNKVSNPVKSRLIGENTALTKTGAGTLTLDKLCREFTGGTIDVAEGTLAIAHGKALADGKVSVAEDATLSVEVTIGGGSIVLSEGAKLFLSNNLFTPSSMDGSNDEWYSTQIYTTHATGGSQDGSDNDTGLGGFVVLSLDGGDEGESGESEAIVLDVMTADASLSCGGTDITDINNETLALLDAYTVYDSGFDAYTKTWQISNDGTLQLALTPAVVMAAYSDDPSPVPEPSAFGLLSGLGAIAVNCARRRRLVK